MWSYGRASLVQRHPNFASVEEYREHMLAQYEREQFPAAHAPESQVTIRAAHGLSITVPESDAGAVHVEKQWRWEGGRRWLYTVVSRGNDVLTEVREGTPYE